MKIQFKYGLIIGLGYALWTSLEYYTKLHQTPFGRYSGITIFLALIISCIIFGIKEVRATKYNGSINYAQAIFAGLTISAIAAITLAIFNYICFEFFYPHEYVDYLISMNEKVISEGDKQPEEIKKMMDEVRAAYTTANQTSAALMGTFTLGIIASAIISAFLRTRDTFTINKEKNN